jgi:hypothetical protein
MPNLDHDPRNPTDLMDRPIKEGDIVAWGTTYGRSPAVAVCRINKIRYVKNSCAETNWKRIEVPQDVADDYTLQLEVIKTTGYGSSGRNGTSKLKSVQIVKNVVLLEPLP